MDDVRHIGGAGLDVGGVFTGEEFVYRFLKDFQPAVELLAAHVGQRDEPCVFADGIPPEATVAKQHGLPEGIHFR